MILEALTLVDNEVREAFVPGNLVNLGLIADGNLVGGNNDGEVLVPPLFVVERTGEHCLSLRRDSVVPHHGEGGKPLLKLSYPVGKSGKRCHNEEGSRHVLREEGGDGSNHLDGLTQTW